MVRGAETFPGVRARAAPARIFPASRNSLRDIGTKHITDDEICADLQHLVLHLPMNASLVIIIAGPLWRRGGSPDFIPIARGLGVHVVGGGEDADAVCGGKGG